MSIALCSSSGSRVDDVGEDAALGRLVDVGGVLGRQQRDHWAGGFADDLRDQLECMLGVQAEADQGDVGPLSRGYCPDLLDGDLARDHLVPEPCDDLGEQLESLALLVCDQHAQVPDLVLPHPHRKFSASGVRSSTKKPDVDTPHPRVRRASLPCCCELCREGRGPGRLPELRRARGIQHQRSERGAPGSYPAAVSELWEGPPARDRRSLEHRRDGELGPACLWPMAMLGHSQIGVRLWCGRRRPSDGSCHPVAHPPGSRWVRAAGSGKRALAPGREAVRGDGRCFGEPERRRTASARATH